MLPPFVPFAQAYAAVITAALTGSLYYMASSPKGFYSFSTIIFYKSVSFKFRPDCLSLKFGYVLSDPTYVVAPVLQSRTGREDLKKLFAGSFSHFLSFIYTYI